MFLDFIKHLLVTVTTSKCPVPSAKASSFFSCGLLMTVTNHVPCSSTDPCAESISYHFIFGFWFADLTVDATLLCLKRRSFFFFSIEVSGKMPTFFSQTFIVFDYSLIGVCYIFMLHLLKHLTVNQCKINNEQHV